MKNFFISLVIISSFVFGCFIGGFTYPIMTPKGKLISIESPSSEYIAEIHWLFTNFTYHCFLEIYDKHYNCYIRGERYLFSDDVLPIQTDNIIEWKNNTITINNSDISSKISKVETKQGSIIVHINKE